MHKNETDRKQKERVNEQQSRSQLSSVTEKSTPENQNQQHNVRKEGIGPVNQKK